MYSICLSFFHYIFWFDIISYFHYCYDYYYIIASIIIFINFLIFSFFISVFFVLFSRVSVLLLIKQLVFSHETVRVCKLFCLLVYLLLFLEVKLQDKNLQHHCFSPAPKRFTILLVYCYFDVILDLILNFTIFVATHFIINLFQKIIW